MRRHTHSLLTPPARTVRAVGGEKGEGWLCKVARFSCDSASAHPLQHEQNSSAKTGVGTPIYMAPEIIYGGNRYDAKVRGFAARTSAPVASYWHPASRTCVWCHVCCAAANRFTFVMCRHPSR